MKSGLEAKAIGSYPIGELIDQLYTLREDRRKLTREDNILKERENQIEAYLLEEMAKTKEESKGGKKCLVSIKREELPDIYNWDKLYAYITKNKAYRLLQRRATIESFRELWDDGVVVPGVKKMFRITLSVSMKRAPAAKGATSAKRR